MVRQQQEISFDKFIEKQRTILLNKGNDYSNEDRLSNFKYAGDIICIGAKMSCLSLIATKVARLGNLLKTGAKPNNESVEDSLLDLANYTQLLNMIIEDENTPSTKTTIKTWFPKTDEVYFRKGERTIYHNNIEDITIDHMKSGGIFRTEEEAMN